MIFGGILAAFIGLASGAVVSGAVFAFIAAIGVVPRMAKRTATEDSVIIYEEAIIWGGILGATTLVFDFSLPVVPVIAIILSLLAGIFFGVLAMSLAEVLDVLPVLAGRIAVKNGMLYFVLAIALGKAAGSLLYFIVSGFHTPGG
ncbi:MAG: stage V sporulation protein AB [Clostridiales bacterium]|jgi:stage V sporulation protein AB|nr:stage V sporulation protein AB [Clostridiales bacterium]